VLADSWQDRERLLPTTSTDSSVVNA